MTPQFRYPLDCLLKKHRWEQQMLQQEAATAQKALDVLLAEIAALKRGIVAIDASLQDGRHSVVMDLRLEGRLRDYRTHQEDGLAVKHKEAADAETTLQHITDQLLRARNAVRGHEDHRERLAGEFRLAAQRQLAVRADDEWLLRRGWQERAA